MRRTWLGLVAVVLLGACGSPTGAIGPTSPSPTAVESSPTPSPSPPPAPSPSPSPSPSAPPVHLIKISLSAQHLWAYEGDTAVISTDVTTGMPALPTPVGSFRIMAKYAPYRFISPWPRGSPYYYDPLWVNFAMLFADGGYFIHDAWWQINWGPGANLKTGSHGCVNVPPAAMPALYGWTRVGDLVEIVP